MYPVYVYATFEPDKSNDNQIYESLRTYFPDFERDFIFERARNGYFPQYIMTTVFLPIIHALYKNSFELILRELTMDVIDFINIESSVDSIIMSDDQCYFHQKYRETQRKLYYDMMNNGMPKQIDRNAFCSAVLEVFPNKECTGGHAITLIKCKNDTYYIIDDQNMIDTLDNYFRLRKSRMHHISVRDIDEATIANINAFLHAKCKIDPECGISTDCGFSKRVTRYELNFDHNFMNFDEVQLLKDNLKTDTEEANLTPSEPLDDMGYSNAMMDISCTERPIRRGLNGGNGMWISLCSLSMREVLMGLAFIAILIFVIIAILWISGAISSKSNSSTPDSTNSSTTPSTTAV